MKFQEHMDEQWLVVDLVPGLIEVHAGRSFGSPVIINRRVQTEVAAARYRDHDWRDVRIKKMQAFAAYCFEAGREYQRSRSLRKRIDKAVSAGWEQYREKKEAGK